MSLIIALLENQLSRSKTTQTNTDYNNSIFCSFCKYLMLTPVIASLQHFHSFSFTAEFIFILFLMFWRTTVPSWHLTWRRADDICLHNHRYIPNDMHSSFNSCSFFFSCYGTELCGVALVDDTDKLWTIFPLLWLLFSVSLRHGAQRWFEASQEIPPHSSVFLRFAVWSSGNISVFLPSSAIYLCLYLSTFKTFRLWNPFLHFLPRFFL